MNHSQPYRPPLPQIPAGPLLGNPCDPCDPRSPMNPLAGIRATHRTTYGYREASPDGDSLLFGITAMHPVVPQPIMNYESCIMHCYTFSAKEKDSETGLSYFGSRYYSSDLSIWLSMDPQAAKYPHQSNYVYCSNNPLKVIDPNGEDEWDLEKDGTLSQRPNGRTDVDIIHAKDKKGNNVERYYKAGTININSQCDEKYDNDVGWFTTDKMEFNDSETATDFFEFAANYSDVEWALKISPDKSIVGTSHDPGFVNIDSPKNMTYDIHSHIDDPNKYMGSDHLKAMEYYNKGVTSKVYEVGKQSYATYNPTSFRLDGPREISMTLERKISLLKVLLR